MQSWQIAEKYVEDTIEECKCEYSHPWVATVSILQCELSRIMIELQVYSPQVYELVSKRLIKKGS